MWQCLAITDTKQWTKMTISLNNYIDIAKQEQDCDSYTHLAERIGISRGGLSHIRNGGTVSEDTLTKIGLLAGVKPELVHASYYLARPVSRETKKMWVRLVSQAWSVLGAACFPKSPTTESMTTIGSSPHKPSEK